MGLGKNNEEKFYDSNIDIKELKKKCGKTLSNDYNTKSYRCKEYHRFFVIER